MAQSTPLFVGLDVHKDSIAVAHATADSAAPPVFVGAIGSRQADLDQLHLTPVYVPSVEDEAIRDLCRARDAARVTMKDARLRLKTFLRRHGVHYVGRAAWTAAHKRFLAKVVCATPAQQIVFQEQLRAVDEQVERIARLETGLRDALPTWRLAPVSIIV